LKPYQGTDNLVQPVAQTGKTVLSGINYQVTTLDFLRNAYSKASFFEIEF